jgi:hypothetical protein
MPFDYNNAVHNKQVSGGTAAEYLAAMGSDGIHTNTFYLSAENRVFLGKSVNSLIELAAKTDLIPNYITGIASNNHILLANNSGVLSGTLKLSAKSGNRTSVISTTGEEGVYTEGYTIHPDSQGMIEIVGQNQIRLLPLSINDVLDAGALSMTNYLNSVNYSATNKVIQTGDFVICNAEEKIYIHKGTYVGNITDFQEMRMPIPSQTAIRGWFSQGSGINYVNTTGVIGVRLGASAGLLNFDGTGGLVSSLPTWTQVSGKPSFSAVAITGSYNDLSDKPTIPTAQINSDWNATNGITQILNKPSLRFGALSLGGVLNWNDITNARSGNGNTLLKGDAVNGFGVDAYFHSFSFEFSTADGTGNLQQLAIPYYDGNIYYRGRYETSYTSWKKVMTENDGDNRYARINTENIYSEKQILLKGVTLDSANGIFNITNNAGTGTLVSPVMKLQANQISLNASNIFAPLPDETTYQHIVTIGGDGTSKLGKTTIANIVKANNGLNRASDGNIKMGGNFTEVTTANLSGFSYSIAGGTTGKSVVFSDVSTSPFMLITGKVRNISDDFECTATGKGLVFKDDAGNTIRLRCSATGNFYREILA